MRILSFSTVYPHPADPGRGSFVRTRLRRIAASRQAELKVLSPVLAFDYSNPSRLSIPARETDGSMEILHPRWLYIPGAGAVTALLLAAQMVIPTTLLRRRYRFDLIDAHFGYPEAISAALLAGIFRVPFTITMRGSELLHSNFPFRLRLMKWAFRRAAHVIAVSGELRQLAIRLGAAPERVSIIPNGLDSDLYSPRSRPAIRSKLNLAPDRKYILTAGHLIELKGHHHAVAALKLLRDGGTDAHLLIAGGAPGAGVANFESNIRRIVTESGLEGQVTFLGHLPPASLSEFLSAADVFCLASSREGFPNVVQEALGCGTPVVATRVGAVPEILTLTELGLIVPPNDPEALAQAFHTALARTWDAAVLADFGRRRSWNQVASEVLSVFRQLVAGNWNGGGAVKQPQP